MLKPRIRPPAQRALLTLALFALLACGPSSDDGSWREAFDASATGWLMNVWGPSPEELFIPGGTPTRGLIMHYDGERFSELALGIDVPLLNWCHGFGPSDVTVVGNAGTVLHFDGSAWSQQPTPTDQDLWGVWGSAPDDLWAVGGKGLLEGQATILHFDGSSWQAETLPVLARPRVYAFFKVWGSSASDVWVVGQRGAVLHYDGSAWTEVPIGSSDDLVSVWGTGPDRVAITGGRGNGMIATFDGTSWAVSSLAPLPGLNGVWMRSDDVIHVVGIDGTTAVVDFETHAYEEILPATTETFHS
ncbi:MAG: hypothetical protein OEY14_05560, partial [Myxococcales bacterium]|nr:hypothetical protein [Myxococcales bacterium]